MYKVEKEELHFKVVEEKKSETLSMHHLIIIFQNSHHVLLLVGGLGQTSGQKDRILGSSWPDRRPVSIRHPKPVEFRLDLGSIKSFNIQMQVSAPKISASLRIFGSYCSLESCMTLLLNSVTFSKLNRIRTTGFGLYKAAAIWEKLKKNQAHI